MIAQNLTGSFLGFMMNNYDLIMLCARFDFGETKAIAKAVLVALASYYNEEHAGSWPGQKSLLPCASCNRKSLMTTIEWLESRNLIYIDRLTGKNNFYRFNIDLLKTGKQSTTSPVCGTGPKNGTSPKNGTTPVPNMGLHQSQICDHTSPIYGTQNTNIKQILNTKEIHIYEPLGEENGPFSPIKTQLEEIQAEHVIDLQDDPKRILTVFEMRNLARINRINLNITERLKLVAERKTITTEIFQECVSEYQKTPRSIGWLVGMLDNVSRDPNKLNKKLEDDRATKAFLEDFDV